MPNFGTLLPEDVEIKVNEITVQGAVITLYKTATVDQMMLEEKYPGKWQIAHRVEHRANGTEEVISIIKIYNDELKEWLSFDNVGDEQQGEDAIKKQFTDADKRAGFACGIGIELKQIPFELRFPFEKLGSKTETGQKNDFGQDSYRIPPKDLVVIDLVYENSDSIRRKLTSVTVKCVSSGQTHMFDLTKDPDISREATITDISTKTAKRGRPPKNNAKNAATPTLVSTEEKVEAPAKETVAEPEQTTLDAFMDIPVNAPEEVLFDEATTPVETATPSPTATTEDTKEETVANDVPSTPVEAEEDVTPREAPAVNTPPYDVNDPGSAFVKFGRFEKTGARVRDLKPHEARYMYLNPRTDAPLKEAIRLFALSNPVYEEEFTSHGIPLSAA